MASPNVRAGRAATPVEANQDRPATYVAGHETRPADRRRHLLFVATALLVASALRLTGLWKDLWLDEVWSIQVASQLTSALQIPTLHHEINHYLNTLWLYWIGPDAADAIYRLPSFVAGVLTVLVAGLIGRRRSGTAMVVVTVIFAFSYVLVLYASEARGYAALVLFAVTAFYTLEAATHERGRRWELGYAINGMFGVIAHPTFASVIAAGVTWSAYRCYRSGRPLTSCIRTVTRTHGGPLFLLGVLYLVDFRKVVAGGGTPVDSLIDAYGGSFAWALGTPLSASASVVTCVVAVLLIDVGLRRLAATGSDEWVFFVSAIVVFPLVLVLVRGSSLVYTRHFLTGITFVLLVVGLTIADWWTRGRRTAVVVVLAAYCMANGWHIMELAVRGRGQYRAAIRYMVDHTPGSELTVGGDQDFRIGLQLTHDFPKALGAKTGRYVDRGSWPAEGPRWLILQRESFEPVRPIDDAIVDDQGRQFDLVEIFPSAPLSGLHWYLYRNRTSR